MKTLQTINGTHTIHFYGIPSKWIARILCFSKSETETARIYSVHFFVLFVFSFVLNKKDDKPSAPKAPITNLSYKHKFREQLSQ